MDGLAMWLTKLLSRHVNNNWMTEWTVSSCDWLSYCVDTNDSNTMYDYVKI